MTSKYFGIFYLTFSLFTFANTLRDQDQTVANIVAYAKNKTRIQPTINSYLDLNISEISKENIASINKKIIDIELNNGDDRYRYNTSLDYNYTFKNAKKYIHIIPLVMKNSIIYLNTNNFDYSNTSIFLEFKIDTTQLGKYFTPIISVTYNNKTYKHTFETNAQGNRYINLSDINLTNHSTIKLSGKHISLNNQKVQLITFKKPQLKNKRILIIAPHPDDAEIAAFGLYKQYAKDTTIITVTAGDYGSDNRYNEIFSKKKDIYLAKGKIRTLDSITVPLLAGIKPEKCINLGYFDGTLHSMKNSPNKEIYGRLTETKDINTFRKYNISTLAKNLSGTTSWESLVNNLANLLNILQPDIIVTPHPKMDRHSDHKLSSEALFEALKKSSIRKGQLFLYTNHATNSEYYPYGQVGDAIDLPPEFTAAVYFNSIYSHPVSTLIQKEKIFSLESMSDLRFLPEGSIFKSPCQNKLPIICKDYSYLRRSVRRNELFFIIDIPNMF